MTFDNFWKEKQHMLDWSKEDVDKSTVIPLIIKKYHNKNNLNGIKIVELGSGIGIVSYALAKKGAKCTLLDKSNEVSNLIKNYWEDIPCEFKKEDILKLKKEHHSKYDLVISFGLCEHFKEKERELVLESHLKACKSGGLVVISVPNYYGIFYRLGMIIQKLLGKWDFGYEKGFTGKELKKYFKKQGLIVELFFNGFYSSMYDLIIKKPLKLMNIKIKRQFDNKKSIFDNPFGSGIVCIVKKS